MVPGQMFALALTMTLLMDSKRLSRPGVCALLGAALGLGMLVKYSFLLFSLPLMAAVALRGSLESRKSWKGILSVVGVLLALAVLILHLGREMQEGCPGLVVMPRIPFLIANAELLFVLLLLLAVRIGVRNGWDAGTGLAISVAVAGLVCSPWYMAHLDLMWTNIVVGQWSYAPIARGLGPLASYASALATLQDCYAGGLLWFLGVLALLGWHRVHPRAYSVLGGFLGAMALYTVLLPSMIPRYLAPILPLALALAFLWAARWRVTFATCLALQLAIGALQIPWWPPLVEGCPRWGPPEMTDQTCQSPPLHIDMIPAPTVPGSTVDPFNCIADGSVVAFDLKPLDSRGFVRSFLSNYLVRRVHPLKPVKGAVCRFNVDDRPISLSLFRVVGAQ